MRYIIAVLFVALAVVGACKKKEDVPTTGPEVRYLSSRQDLIRLEQGHGCVRIFPYNRGEHSYLVFVYENGYNEGGGISVVELTDAPR